MVMQPIRVSLELQSRQSLTLALLEDTLVSLERTPVLRLACLVDIRAPLVPQRSQWLAQAFLECTQELTPS